MTFWQLLPCPPHAWLCKLAEGWRLACEDRRLPVADFTEWNSGWRVCLLKRDA